MNNVSAKKSKISIFNVSIDNMLMKDAVDWITKRAKGERKVIAQFANADCLNKAYNNKKYRHALSQANRIFADGAGIALAGKLKRQPLRDNVNGTDMFPLLCKQAQAEGLKLFLLGARPNIAKAVKLNMHKKYPAIEFVGAQNGYFDLDDTKDIIKKINKSKADILLVAFGAPTQELWIDKFKQEIDAKVCIGVGGLFDFYSGRISRAPLWLRKLKCEWVWRLLQEPSRMWKRYLLGNVIFVFRTIKETLNTSIIEDTGGNYAKR